MFKNIRSKNSKKYNLGVHPHAKPNLMHLPQEELNALAEKQSREIERDNMMLDTIKIKKLHPDAITPTRSHPTDSGLDLYALENTIIPDGETVLVKTGIAVDIPAGYEAQVRPRSGLTLEGNIKVNLGTVDASYRGDVGIITTCTFPVNSVFSGKEYTVRKGDKIAQLVIQRVELPDIKVVEDFESGSARGTAGFGSTGHR